MVLGAASLAGAAPRAEAPQDPTTVVWAARPADKWENAHPVGNGRLGAMVFGRTDEERIQLNEETYWTGGPYSTTVKGGAAVLPEIQRLIFEGRLKQAHILFGRRLMGYPVEQQKYQSLGNFVLRFLADDPIDRLPALPRPRLGGGHNLLHGGRRPLHAAGLRQPG